MTFLQLWEKIGKQPMKNIRNMPVIAKLHIGGKWVEVPLKLEYNQNKLLKMYFVLDESLDV